MTFGIASQVTAEPEKLSTTYTDVTAKVFHDFIYNTTKPTLIDVRTQAELENDGFIHGSTWIQHDKNGQTISDTIVAPSTNASQLILVYCKSGVRGGLAAGNLTAMGYTNVINMAGGLKAWLDAGYFVDQTVSKFKATIQAGGSFNQIDVRTQAEWDTDGYIHGATLITWDSIAKNFTDLTNLPTNKSELLLINCKSSGRSTSAAKLLEDMGYTNIKNMAGGLNAWITAGYFRDIPAATFKTKVTSEITHILIDVRAQSEWDTGYLHGAILITHTDILLHTDLLPENKSELVLIYCKSGGRGSIASQTLEDLGYTNVLNMGSGISAWKNLGYYTEVPAATYKSIIDTNKYDLLLDVRTPAEYETGYIAGAVNIQHDTILTHTDMLPENKSSVILVYCKVGGRGSIASQTLEDLGYINVINLGGGITAWNASNYAIAGLEATTTPTTETTSNSVDGFGIVALMASFVMIATVIRKRK
jgi:rhodanese-related sulfurtransferase